MAPAVAAGALTVRSQYAVVVYNETESGKIAVRGPDLDLRDTSAAADPLNANFSFATAVGLFNSVINMILLVMVNAFAKRVSETSLW